MSTEGLGPGSWQPRTVANEGVENMRIMIVVMDGPGKGVVGLRQRFSGTDRGGIVGLLETGLRSVVGRGATLGLVMVWGHLEWKRDEREDERVGGI